MSMSMSTSIPLSCHSSLSWSLTTRAIPPKNLRALRDFVLNPARHPHGPTSRVSITITSTAALSTSTTLFPFRDHPCHSVATPARTILPQKPS
jgi:hypothetical protein